MIGSASDRLRREMLSIEAGLAILGSLAALSAHEQPPLIFEH